MTEPRERRRRQVFASVAEERRYRKQRLAAGFRLFGQFGFDEGVAGHITARDPELTDHFWVNPFGMSFKQIRVCDLVLVNGRGEVVEGTWPVNRAAFCIHGAVHDARPDVVAAAHSHSVYGKTLSALGVGILSLTQDACAFYRDHAVFDDFSGVVLDVEEGKRIAAALGGTKAAILRNHGLLTVGRSVDEAVWWFITMERSAQVQVMAMSTGSYQLIDDEMAAITAEQVGSEDIGWRSFQPLYDWITETQPDLLTE